MDFTTMIAVDHLSFICIKHEKKDCVKRLVKKKNRGIALSTLLNIITI